MNIHILILALFFFLPLHSCSQDDQFKGIDSISQNAERSAEESNPQEDTSGEEIVAVPPTVISGS
ncbi:MAG: hypothetical protein HRU09_20070 [Oligoflexales bacterium]|nr:hypothetical protein [Oligoflexales bacterium]